MLENKFKSKLAKEIETRFPGSMVLHLSPNEFQGIPDLMVIYKDKWAALEGKRESSASKRKNQDYYVNKLNAMSYAAFIFPENKEEILNELTKLFES